MAVSNFIPQVWAASILDNFKEKATVSNTVNRDYEGDAKFGNQVNITSFNTPTVIDLTATSRVATPEQLTDATQALVISQEKAIAFYVDDIDRAQAAGSMEPITRDASAALVKDHEGYIFGQMTAGGTDTDPGGTLTLTNAAEAWDWILAQREAFTDAEIPHADRYLGVNSAFASLLLANDAKLTAADTAGDSAALRNATLGNILGFRAYETALFGTAGTPAAVAYHGPSVGFVHQISETEGVRSTDRFADIVRLLSVYGAKVLRAEAVRYVN